MSLVESLLQSLQYEYLMLAWRDVVEICVLSTGIYKFSRWLTKDSSSSLVGYLYAYCALLFASYSLPLPTLNLILVVGSPVIIMLFIVFHQERLQKNFITLRRIIPASTLNTNWADTLIRTALHIINANKQLLCVIEHRNDLTSFITNSCPLSTPINPELLHLLLTSADTKDTQLIWITTQGQLRGINCSWNIGHEHTVLETQAAHMPQWKQDALLMTQNSDALVLAITPATRMFEIVINGKSLEQLNAHAALHLIKRYYQPDSLSSKKGDSVHATHTKNTSYSNRHP